MFKLIVVYGQSSAFHIGPVVPRRPRCGYVNPASANRFMRLVYRPYQITTPGASGGRNGVSDAGTSGRIERFYRPRHLPRDRVILRMHWQATTPREGIAWRTS